MQARQQLSILAVSVLMVAACSGGAGSATTRPATTQPATTQQSVAPVTSVTPSSAPDPETAAAAACPSPSLEASKKTVNVDKFKKPSPWTVGVAMGELLDSWTAFNYAEIKNAASKDTRIAKVLGSDAGFDVSKHIANIEDLITQKVSVIIYLPVDNGALSAVLQKAEAAGIPTVNEGNGFSDNPGITANAQVDNYILGREVAVRLMASLHGKGQIVSIIPIAGTTAATLQHDSLMCVLKLYPGVTLLDEKNGDWDTAKSKTITEAWLQRYPKIDGVYSPAGLMSHGVVEAFEEAKRLDEVTMSPGDESNGWLKWIAAHPEKNTGLVQFPVVVGKTAVQVATDILDGKSVPFGTFTGANYVDAQAAAAMANPSKGDDWWPNDLPGGDITK